MASDFRNDKNEELDYYSLLGVSPRARLIEIKKSFRLLQRKIHPDSTKTKTESSRNDASNLNKAYKILSNPLTRLEYDLNHGFKEQNESNLLKLEEYKKRQARKLRENMKESANKSREIECCVVQQLSDGTKLKNCGLIITKARYGLLDLEHKQRLNLIKNDMPSPRPFNLQRSLTFNNTNSNNLLTQTTPTATKTDFSASGYESETDNNLKRKQKKTKKKRKEEKIEYTIDVTDALQCMVTHRGNLGGYVEIEDNYDKSKLDGFYNPGASISGERCLEIEYMFNRKYHYIKLNNFEYVCIPNKNHIVHIFDDDITNSNSKKQQQQQQNELSTSNITDLNINIDSKILDSAHSFTTFSPVTIQNGNNGEISPRLMTQTQASKRKQMDEINKQIKAQKARTKENSSSFSFMSSRRNNGRYASILAATSSLSHINRSEVINLPSGKTAIQSRPSLAGLKKFSEIEKIRNEIKTTNNNSDNNNISNYNNYMLNKKKMINLSMMLIFVGVIGGLGYYYVDKKQRSKANNNDVNNKNDRFSLFAYKLQESALYYLHQCWNYFIYEANMKNINKKNKNDENNNKHNLNDK